MAKVKALEKQKKSIKNGFTKFELNKKLLMDKKLITQVLAEALMENDLEIFRDVLITHLRATSKTELSKKTGIGRRTLYDLIDSENFDPRLSTLAALLSKIAA
jgi:DNA-binding phage protein